jgi:hypothetical protein
MKLLLFDGFYLFLKNVFIQFRIRILNTGSYDVPLPYCYR